MELTLLEKLIESISYFSHLSSREQTKCEPIRKYYQKTEEILNLSKPVLDAIINAEISSYEKLQMAMAVTSQSVDELREMFENWQPLMSRAYLVLQAESLITKIQASSLEIFELVKSSEQHLPPGLSVTSLEHIVRKMKHIEHEKTSEIMKNAISDQLEGSGVTSDSMAKVADCLCLNSNQELLIEAVALENLKENLEQDEKNGEVDHIDQMLTFVMHMHEQLVMLKQSQTCGPVTIPADFCCPLSLELMTDPVIVASGQTYERAFIQEWIDLGLRVCPKTRQPLGHTNLISNYTVKGWIANWCELNNVQLPDPIKSVSLNQPSSLLGHVESDAPRDSHALTHSRGNRSTLPFLAQTLGFSIASGGPWTEQQSSHPRTSSEDSSTGVPENGHELDLEKMSLRGSHDRLASSDERNSDSSFQFPTSPSNNGASTEHGHQSQGHNRTTSASSTISSSKVSQATSSDGNEASSIAVVEVNDTSREGTSQPRTEATLSVPQTEPEFPSRLETRTRNQQIWYRPSERFVPRIVQSSAVETRPDLSEVDAQVKNLIEDLKSPSIDAQRNATAKLRLLAKHNMDNRIVIANSGAISLLVKLLHSADTEIQECAVTALLNLSINNNNKTAIANANAIESLIHVLQTGSPEAKENSAATLFSLSVVEDNKVKIAKLGAIKPLVELLGNGTPRGKRDAATALFNLSLFHENKAHIVEAGAIKYLVELMDSAAGMVDKAVAVLSNLSTIDEGRQGIGQEEGGIPLLVEVVELGSARGKENAAAALLQLCSNSNKFCNMVLQEGAVPPLVALQQSGTPRAREKAQQLLNCFKRQRHDGAGRR